ncbi:hypothetical protein CIG1485E_a0100 (plasmid) [Campylobacter iguaniorum]|jgi:hypothetical protein|uniref:Uncharacterized protein n=1 Tax=Campylobacter iguaniorum TaxID=1244531 RepID=A0A076FBM3_9BACT|nr:hypothetical protein [Campylobacter iguaniorum]AII15625.1 hypothetical protein CIG1485E_a0100 [Campylobacter iguaniorum]
MWKIIIAFDKKLEEPICSADYEPHLEKELTCEFRLLDDDGEVYAKGYSDDGSSENAFAPLDDYGMPAWGCTEIQYKEKGKWETL